MCHCAIVPLSVCCNRIPNDSVPVIQRARARQRRAAVGAQRGRRDGARRRQPARAAAVVAAGNRPAAPFEDHAGHDPEAGASNRRVQSRHREAFCDLRRAA